MSNRTPRKKEIERGGEYFFELVEIFDIHYIGCIGRKSFNAIKDMSLIPALGIFVIRLVVGKEDLKECLMEYMKKLRNNS